MIDSWVTNILLAFNDFALGRLSPSEYMDNVSHFTLYFVYLFIAKFVLVYVYSLGASIAAIRTTKALRLDFLQSLLRQDISFFDSKEGGSPSVKVTTNGYHIHDRLSIVVEAMLTSFVQQ
jgi:ATP-binding cassette subfamily B (MDR/TAP) protein 1